MFSDSIFRAPYKMPIFPKLTPPFMDWVILCAPTFLSGSNYSALHNAPGVRIPMPTAWPNGQVPVIRFTILIIRTSKVPFYDVLKERERERAEIVG